MNGSRLRFLSGFVGLSLGLLPAVEGRAEESILRIGSKTVAVPESGGGQDMEKQEAIAKQAFMQNYDHTGKAFTMSLPVWARPVREFLPGFGLTNPEAVGGAQPYGFGMGAPRMGVLAPRNVHTTAVSSDLTMQEDVPRITFESCVRMKLNSGLRLEKVFQMCQSANPDYQAPALPRSQAVLEAGAGIDKDTAGEKARAVTQAALAAPKPEAGTGWLSQTDAGPAVEQPEQKHSAGYAGSECDVSRDPSVMLSQECLSRADSLLEEGMASAGGGALHVPLPMQPGQEAPAGKHSLLTNIAPRSVPEQDVNFASVDPDRMLQQNMIRSHPVLSDPQAGSVVCNWVVNGASFVGVQYRHSRNKSVKSCIQSALASANIDTGTISISFKDQVHGLNQTMVECHRRMGQDTCGIVR